MLQSDKVQSGEEGKIRLRQAYKEAGLTIEKLADNAQVSPDTVKRLLGTKQCPNGVERWAVTNIANFLNIKPTDIVDPKDWNPQQQLPPEFEPLIKGKTKTFCGRKFVFAAFEKFINSNPNGYFTVVGDAGMGKSALAAKYVFDKQVPCYFNILAEGRNRPALFLKTIRQQLINRYQLQDANDDDLPTLLTKVSKKLPAGDRLVIVVDALDEVEQELGAENLLYLPRELPERVYFLLTRRPYSLEKKRLQVSVPEDCLDLSAGEYANFSREDVKAYIRLLLNDDPEYKDALDKWIQDRNYTPEYFVEQVAEKSENNFMYLYHALPAIAKGEYEDLALEQFPKGLQDYSQVRGRDNQGGQLFATPTVTGIHLEKMRRNNTRSLKVRQNCVDKVKVAYQHTKYNNQTELAKALGLSLSTVSSYLNGERIDFMNFKEISVELNVTWTDVADLEDPGNDRGHSQGFKLPDKLPPVLFWVEGSRSQELQDLKAWLLNPETKTMTITAKSIVGLAGIGKTTLANQLVRQLHAENAPFAVAAWESLRTGTDKAYPFGDIIDSLLKTLSNGQIRPEDIAQYNSFKKTERLLELLKDKPCLVVLDNIEPILRTGNAAKAGYFASDCEEYEELFKQLVEAEHQSKVIFTSRESLAELTSGASQTIPLSGLESEYAITLLQDQKFKLTATQDELTELFRRYQGHPKALELVAGAIRDDREFQGRVGRFLQDRDWLLIRTLDNLIDRVINRLSSEEKDCLIRISVYQTSEHSLVASAIAAQLPEESRSSLTENIINPLKCRQLLDYDIERDSYQLHPLIQEKAYKLLYKDSEAACTAHRRAALFYLKLAGNVEHPEETKLAFEAFEQFYKAKDIEQCYQTLRFKILGAETLEALRTSEKIFNYTNKIIDFGERLIEQLTEDKKMLILIPLGIAYSEVGRNYQALEISQLMMEYADNNNGSTQGKNLITFLQVTSRLIAGKAYRLIGNLTQALKYCEEATHISHQSKYPQGKAFALYELANVYLEIGKPEKALRGYVIAAFNATGNSITSELYQLSNILFQPVETLTPRFKQLLQKYGGKKKPGNNFKKWRILLSWGECFNKMKIYSLAKFCINESIQLLLPTEKNPLSWSYSELALCEASMGEQEKAIDHYNHALDLSKELGSLIRAKVLEKVGDWHYQQERYEESLKKYQELDELLKPTEYKLLQAKACYRLSLIYQKPEYLNLHLASEYCNHALIIAEELGVPLAEKCRELQRQLLR